MKLRVSVTAEICGHVQPFEAGSFCKKTATSFSAFLQLRRFFVDKNKWFSNASLLIWLEVFCPRVTCRIPELCLRFCFFSDLICLCISACVFCKGKTICIFINQAEIVSPLQDKEESKILLSCCFCFHFLVLALCPISFETRIAICKFTKLSEPALSLWKSLWFAKDLLVMESVSFLVYGHWILCTEGYTLT